MSILLDDVEFNKTYHICLFLDGYKTKFTDHKAKCKDTTRSGNRIKKLNGIAETWQCKTNVIRKTNVNSFGTILTRRAICLDGVGIHGDKLGLHSKDLFLRKMKVCYFHSSTYYSSYYIF